MELLDSFYPLTLNVGLAIHNADWNWKNVHSPFTRIYYVSEGCAQIALPQGTYTLRPGYLYIIPAFTTHSYICQEYFVHYYIHIYEDVHFDISLLEKWEFPIEVKAHPDDYKLVNRLCELNPRMKLSQSNPNTYDNDSTLHQNIERNKQRSLSLKMESRGILFLLISRFLKEAKQKSNSIDPRIYRALEWIQQNLTEPISVEELADATCLCKDYFIRLFREEMKMTPHQYITLKKIEKAQLMLVAQDIPTKKIAYNLGYDDYSYFIRTFRKTVGCTPQQYKENEKRNIKKVFSHTNRKM